MGDPNFYHTRNESRRARIAQEMLDTGNFIVPQLEGKVILTKPPLFYWAVAFCSWDHRVTEYTAHFPSAACAVGTVLVTFLIGSYLFNRRVGFWSALCLMVTNIFVAQARYVEMESMLTFFIVLSIYCFLRGYREPRRALFWFILFFAARIALVLLGHIHGYGEAESGGVHYIATGGAGASLVKLKKDIVGKFNYVLVTVAENTVTHTVQYID